MKNGIEYQWNFLRFTLASLSVIRLAIDPTTRPDPPKFTPTANALQLLVCANRVMVVGTLLITWLNREEIRMTVPPALIVGRMP